MTEADAAAGGTHVKVKSPLLDDAPPAGSGKDEAQGGAPRSGCSRTGPRRLTI